MENHCKSEYVIASNVSKLTTQFRRRCGEKFSNAVQSRSDVDDLTLVDQSCSAISQL